MICVVDQHREVEDGQVCPGCAHRIACDLRDIPDLYAQISLMPGSGAAEPRVSGSHEPPLPLRVDALDLTMPARAGSVHDLRGDQIGHIAAASVLDDWVRDWREQRGKGERLPEPAVVAVLVDWLSVRLADACHDHRAIDEFAADMRRLRQALRIVVGLIDPRPERLPAPCRQCDWVTLVRVAGDDRPIQCRGCLTWMSEDEYADWVQVLARRVRTAA